MLNSILNLNSGQQQESSEISTNLFQSQQLSGFNGSQNPTGSNSNFSRQLNQFRQLMQGPPVETGKRLPDFEPGSQNQIERQLTEKFSQFQRLINKFQKLLANKSIPDPSAMGGISDEMSLDIGEMQGLINSLSEYLAKLKDLGSEELALNEQSLSQYTESIEVLESNLGKVNITLANSDKLPVKVERLSETVTELLSKSKKTILQLNQALADNKAQSDVHSSAPSKTNSELKAATSNSENLLNSTSTKETVRNTAEKGGDAVNNKLVKAEQGQKSVAADAEFFGAANTKKISNNVDTTTHSRFSLEESKVLHETETRFSAEKLDRLARSLLNNSEGISTLSKNMPIAASPLDAKNLQNLPSMATTSLEPSASIVHVPNEVTSGQNPQSTQISSQSNIQQGLNLKSDFSPNLALRIQWIYQQALSSAQIMMDPPELGPLSVKMQHRGGETNIIFQVNNPQTKEMIEDNLPKLKELLQEQGIALGDTQVRQNQQQKEQNKPGQSQIADGEALVDNDEMPVQNGTVDSEQVSILDTYI